MDRVIAYSHSMRGGMYDDDYTLFESGRVLRAYDNSSYPGDYNLKAELVGSKLKDEVKQRLFNAAEDSDKGLAKRLLAMPD